MTLLFVTNTSSHDLVKRMAISTAHKANPGRRKYLHQDNDNDNDSNNNDNDMNIVKYHADAACQIVVIMSTMDTKWE